MIAISGYRILDAKPWRQGGMADIYRAVDLRTHEQCIVKVLKDKFKTDKVIVDNFNREFLYADTLGRVNDRLARAYLKGRLSDGRPFIVMRMLHGEDVGSLLRRAEKNNQRISIRLAAHIVRETANVLAGLHRFPGRPIIHRDISPDNIVVSRDLKQVYLIDFGIAYGLEGSLIPAGKPMFTAPEGVQKPSPAADVYALGVVLYLLLCSQTQWKYSTLQSSTSQASLMGSVMNIGRLRPNIPAWLIQLLQRMLSLDPARRPSAGEVANELYAALSIAASPGEIEVVLDRASEGLMSAAAKAIIATGALLSVILLSLTIILLFRKPPDPQFAVLEAPPDSRFPAAVVDERTNLWPFVYFTTARGVEVRARGAPLSPAPANVWSDGDRQLFRLHGVWGGAERILCQRSGARPMEFELKWPRLPLSVVVEPARTNNVQVMLVRIQAPVGVEVSLADGAAEHLLAAGRENVSSNEVAHSFYVKWFADYAWQCRPPVLNPDGDRPVYGFRIQAPALRMLEHSLPLLISSDEKLVIRSEIPESKFRAVFEDVKQWADRKSPVCRQWQSVSARTEDWLTVASTTQKRLALVSDGEGVSEPRWPRVRPDADPADESIFIDGELINQERTLFGRRWGSALVYRIVKTPSLDSESQLPQEETETLVLRYGAHSVETDAKELMGLDRGRSLAEWDEALAKWSEYLTKELKEEFGKVADDLEKQRAATSRLVLLPSAETNGEPCWPRVAYKEGSRGPRETIEITHPVNKRLEEDSPITLDGVPWGATVTYTIRRRAAPSVEGLSLTLAPDDLFALTGSSQRADEPTRKETAEKWRVYLTPDLYEKLAGVPGADPVEQFVSGPLAFEKETDAGEAYRRLVRAAAETLDELIQKNPSTAEQKKRFWQRVYEDAARKKEPAIQRGALVRLAEAGADPSEFTPKMLGLPFGEQPDNKITREFHANPKIAATYELRVLPDRSEELDRRIRSAGSRIAAATILPHFIELNIEFKNDRIGIESKWRSRWALIPDDEYPITESDGTRKNIRITTPFYMMTTEMPVSGVRLVQRELEAAPQQERVVLFPTFAALPRLVGEGNAPFSTAAKVADPDYVLSQTMESLAVEFQKWLNLRCELIAAADADGLFRLPTGVEWRFAAEYLMNEMMAADLPPEKRESFVFWRAVKERPGEWGRFLQDAVFFSRTGRDVKEPRPSTHAEPARWHPLGIADLCGNVWEMTRERNEKEETIVRGGSIRDADVNGVLPWRSRPFKDVVSRAGDPIGFRLVLPVPVELLK